MITTWFTRAIIPPEPTAAPGRQTGVRLTALLALLLVTACGQQDAVVEGDPVAHPYDGPMHVDQSFRDRASVLARSGAAGLALECDGAPYAGGGGSYDSGLATVQDSPESAYANLLDRDYVGDIPKTGFRVERDAGERVLLSYDVDERTKVAMVAYDGIRDWEGNTGWGVEAWAQCDPSELPASFTDGTWMQVWEDETGARVPVTKVLSYRGAEHCDWEDITFLAVGGERRGDQYLRDVHGELADHTEGRFTADARLPADATDSGFRRDGRALWLVPSRDAAYLVDVDDPSKVEVWPAATDRIGCA
jgi:hypothetical protein